MQFELGNLNESYITIDFVGKSDTQDIYNFNREQPGSFSLSLESFRAGTEAQLFDSQGNLLYSTAANDSTPGTIQLANLAAGAYSLHVLPIDGDTNYQLSLSVDGKTDPVTGLDLEGGYFSVAQTGKVGIDFAHDGGGYQGELAIFSIKGMENLQPGSLEFVKEAARRALSNSELGYRVIDDATEGANPDYAGGLGEPDRNSGEYLGVKTFDMKPGDVFAAMLVPNGTVQEVFDNPGIGGDKQPLFSLATANPNDAFHLGQLADIIGDGKSLVMEDWRVDEGSDKDYNDIIFTLTGATGKAIELDKVIDPAKDWRQTERGQQLMSYVTPPPPVDTEPPVVETPAPVAETPAPVVETPAPVAETPAPVVELQPPVVEPQPPVAEIPAPVVEPQVPVVEPQVPVVEPQVPVVETPAPVVEPQVPVVETPAPVVEPQPPVIPQVPIGETPVPMVEPQPSVIPQVPVVEMPQLPGEKAIRPVLPLPIEWPQKPKFDANQPLIGVIDTGFSGNNPDFDYSRFILGRDRVSNDDDPLLQPGEGDEHGTFILGLIGALKGNNIGIDGFNEQSPIWLGRAIGSGAWAESLLEFVDAAKASGQQTAIVNLSLDLTQKNQDGSVTTRYEFTPREREAIEYARQNHVLIVTAAGNDGAIMSVLGQASQEFDNILTIGASDGFGRANYSSYGAGLDVLIAGGTIENPVLSTVGDDLGTMAGTSVAAARATAFASLVWAANPTLNYRQVMEILKSSAVDLKTPGWDEETGFGLLNPFQAVKLAQQTAGQEYAPEPWVTPFEWSGQNFVTPEERAAADYFADNGKYYDWNPYTIKSGDNLSQIALNTMGAVRQLITISLLNITELPIPIIFMRGSKFPFPRKCRHRPLVQKSRQMPVSLSRARSVMGLKTITTPMAI